MHLIRTNFKILPVFVAPSSTNIPSLVKIIGKREREREQRERQRERERAERERAEDSSISH